MLIVFILLDDIGTQGLPNFNNFLKVNDHVCKGSQTSIFIAVCNIVL